jgi:hypothetical protein
VHDKEKKKWQYEKFVIEGFYFTTSNTPMVRVVAITIAIAIVNITNVTNVTNVTITPKFTFNFSSNCS